MQISSSVPSCKRDGWRVPRQLKRCRLRQSRSPTFRRTHRASKDGRLLSRPFSTDPLTGAAAAVPRWLAAARTRPGSETDSEVARQATLRGCCRMERRRSTNVTPPSHGVDRRHDKRANLPCHRPQRESAKPKFSGSQVVNLSPIEYSWHRKHASILKTPFFLKKREGLRL